MTSVGHAGRDGTTNVPPETPQIHIPRLTDLLSGPLSCLHGPHLQAFHEMFEELDCTLMENTRAIQLSIGNTVRAPYNLAEKCRPLLEELVLAQRTAEHNSVGEQSLPNNGGRQDVNILAAHDDMQGLNNIFYVISDEEASARSPAVPMTSCSGNDELPLIPPSSHLSNRETSKNLSSESEPLHPKCHSLGEEPDVTCGVSTPVAHIVSHDRDSLNSPGNRHAGKHMTFRHVRYVSPFKGGILLRPPPDMHQAMNLLGCLCADDSPFISTTVIWSGSTQLNGSVITRSFC